MVTDNEDKPCPCPVPILQGAEEVRFSYDGLWARLDRVEAIVKDFDDTVTSSIQGLLTQVSTKLDDFDSETICRMEREQAKAIRVVQKFDDYISGALTYLLTEILRWCFESGIDMGNPSEIVNIRVRNIDPIDVNEEVCRLLNIVTTEDGIIEIDEGVFPSVCDLPAVKETRPSESENGKAGDVQVYQRDASFPDKMEFCCPSLEAKFELLQETIRSIAESLATIARAFDAHAMTNIPVYYSEQFFASHKEELS